MLVQRLLKGRKVVGERNIRRRKWVGHRTMSYGARSGLGQCYHIQTPPGTICDHANEYSYKSSGARAIIKLAGDLQFAEIVRRQFYF